MSAAAAGTARAREWVDHLRAGGTTPWHRWRPEPDGATSGPPSVRVPLADRPLPGAQQLELLRRLNLAAGAAPAGRAALDPTLAERVLAASAPGRGSLDLQLVGADDGDLFGPPPVDPATLPARELLRLAAGLLADDLAALPAPPGASAPPTPRSLPWRRLRPRLAGDPLLAAALGDQLAARGYALGRGDVLVLGRDLEHLLGAVWTARVVEGGAVSWPHFCDTWAERDRLPPRADLEALAAGWAQHRHRVHVVTEPAEVSRLIRTRRPLVVPAPVPAAAAQLALRVSQVLGVLVPAERRPALTRAALDAATATARQLVERAPGAEVREEAALWLPPTVPAERRPWLLEQAHRQRADLAAAEYPVHGRLEALQPAEQPATEELPDAAALTVAVRLLLDTGPGSIQQGAQRETRDQA